MVTPIIRFFFLKHCSRLRAVVLELHLLPQDLVEFLILQTGEMQRFMPQPGQNRTEQCGMLVEEEEEEKES